MKQPLEVRSSSGVVRTTLRTLGRTELSDAQIKQNLKKFPAYLGARVQAPFLALIATGSDLSESERHTARNREIAYVIFFLLITFEAGCGNLFNGFLPYGKPFNPISWVIVWYWLYAFGLAWQSVLLPLGAPSILLCYTLGLTLMRWFARASVKFVTRFYGVEFFCYGFMFVMIVPTVISQLLFGYVFGAPVAE